MGKGIDPAALQALHKETAALWNQPVSEQWTPPWCPHVVGLIAERTMDEAAFLPQRYRCYCFLCKTEHRGECITGAVRNHVAHFASAHIHRDVMAVPPRHG